jgi:catechol 2,3-dioxygenase-like lactoylglutathione lyase family enzyme
MAVALNHIIVPSRDKWASARFLADILGVIAGPEWGPFVSVQTDNGVTLDYMEYAESDAIQPTHYAFLVGDAEFDAGLAKLRAAGIQIFAGPHGDGPGEINHLYGGRGVYFHDANGHLLELITAPYAEDRATVGG